MTLLIIPKIPEVVSFQVQVKEEKRDVANSLTESVFRMTASCYDSASWQRCARRPYSRFNDKKMRTEGSSKCHRKKGKKLRRKIFGATGCLPPRGRVS